MDDTLTKTRPDAILVDVETACALLGGIGRSSLYDEVRSGRLRSCKVRGRRLFRYEDLQDYARGLVEEATP